MSAEWGNSWGVAIVVVRAGEAERITSRLNADLAERLRELPEVSQVDGSLSEMVLFGEGSLLGIPLRGLDPSGFTLETSCNRVNSVLRSLFGNVGVYSPTAGRDAPALEGLTRNREAGQGLPA